MELENFIVEGKFWPSQSSSPSCPLILTILRSTHGWPLLRSSSPSLSAHIPSSEEAINGKDPNSVVPTLLPEALTLPL